MADEAESGFWYGHVDMNTEEKMDVMESFFLAETLKYFYLLFAPENTVDFSKMIFNTEAHPLKIRETTSSH